MRTACLGILVKISVFKRHPRRWGYGRFIYTFLSQIGAKLLLVKTLFLPMLSECKLCLVFGLGSGPAD